MSSIELVVNAGPHARVDTPMRVELGEAAQGAKQARLSETETGRAIPCQLDGTKLAFVLPGLGEKSERRLKVELGAETAQHGGVKLTDKGESGLTVEVNGKLFTTYRYLPKGEVPTLARPFFYPLFGPGGLNVTRHFPMRADVEGEKHDHPHHRGLYVAFGEVNGIDNWSQEKAHGFQTHEKFTEVVGGPVFGRFTEVLRWESHDRKKTNEEVRTFETWNLPQDARLIDLTVSFRATDGAIEFGDTKEGGICSIRVPTTMDGNRAGTIVNSAGGVGEAETWGKPAHWVDYFGPVEGQQLGIAIMDHPMNLRHPTPWHVRDYGLFAANPFGHSYYKASHLANGAYTVPAGGELTFKYRVYLHRGDPKRGDVAGKWHDYAFPPVVKKAE
ncbi:MAG: PmoA family protein [Planctomycetota bacterium]|nr:PmoA family protein [Planctomycetota bacterium]